MKERSIKIPALVLALTLGLSPLASSTATPLMMTANAAYEDYEADFFNNDNDPYSEREVARPVAASIGKVQSKAYPFKNMKAGIKKYAADNSDVKGWLIVPNTNISKPIAFSDKDNNHYAYRDIKGVNYPNTTYQNFVETANYIDCRVKFGKSWKSSSKNTVIYGHNWTNLREPVAVGANNGHIMFGQLPSYTNMDFAKANPHIYFSTNELEGIWRVFCVSYVELSTSFNYNQPNPTNEDYAKLIKEFKDRSLFDFDVDVKETDRILTLSTCTRQYNAGAQQRFVVVARLLRDGEKETDSVAVSVNSDAKKPKFS